MLQKIKNVLVRSLCMDIDWTSQGEGAFEKLCQLPGGYIKFWPAIFLTLRIQEQLGSSSLHEMCVICMFYLSSMFCFAALI